MRVTRRPKAAYHSMYLGAEDRAPFSIKSKSMTRFKAAMVTTTRLKPMPMGPLSWMWGIWMPKKPRTMLTRYKRAMPPVAAVMPSLKFSVALMMPLL